MSLGTRNEKLERLLAAKYELECCCDDDEKAVYLSNFELLLDETLAGKNISRSALIEALKFAYVEYRRERSRAQRRRETL